MQLKREFRGILLVVMVTAHVRSTPQEEADCPSTTATCQQNEEAEVCSARGECICGACSCAARDNTDEIVSGEFCECDNFSCAKDTAGEICSAHGECACGKCACADGWTGDACECSTDTSTCINPGTSEVCSALGDCVCGQCQCHEAPHGNGGKYAGQFCQECPTCPAQCMDFRPCVECVVHGIGPLVESQCDGCSQYNLTQVDNAEVAAESDRLCEFETTDGCKIIYVYSIDSKKSVRAAKELSCPQTEGTVDDGEEGVAPTEVVEAVGEAEATTTTEATVLEAVEVETTTTEATVVEALEVETTTTEATVVEGEGETPDESGDRSGDQSAAADETEAVTAGTVPTNHAGLHLTSLFSALALLLTVL